MLVHHLLISAAMNRRKTTVIDWGIGDPIAGEYFAGIIDTQR